MGSEIVEKYASYLKTERAMSPRSVRDYTSIACELASKLDILSENLTYKQVNDLVINLKETNNWSTSTVYKYSICVRHFFKWIVRDGYRQSNPYPFSEWRKPRRSTPKFLTQSQFENLIDDPHLTHQELTLLWLLWDSGARISEVASLTQQNIDLSKGLVNIPYEISKGNYSYRNVPLSKNAIECLKKQFGFAQRRGHVKAIFISSGNEPMTHSWMQKNINNIGMRLSPLRPKMSLYPHQFRHSFGIRMLEKGVPQVIVQKWLGHQTLQMTSHYINMDAESSRRIFDQYLSSS